MDETQKSIMWFYQNDSQWKDEPLGLQTEETIGSWGGLLTAMTAVVNLAGYEETPQSLNDNLKANDGYVGSLALPAVLPILYPKVIYRGFDGCLDQTAPTERINRALEDGQVVLAQVDWNPKAGINTHWVVLVERRGSDYLIFDPYRYKGDDPGTFVLLTKRYKYRGKESNQSITAVVWFEIVHPTEPEDSVVQQVTTEAVDVIFTGKQTKESVNENAKLILVPTVDGLTFRKEPIIKVENEIRKLETDDQLFPDDSASLNDVIEKIGILGEWIHVRDKDGIQGYVAAWYVRMQSDVMSGR